MGPPAAVAEGRTECDRAAVAVSDDDGRTIADDVEEIVDVPVEGGVDRERIPRPVVAATVVGDGVEVVETTYHPAEAGGTVQ